MNNRFLLCACAALGAAGLLAGCGNHSAAPATPIPVAPPIHAQASATAARAVIAAREMAPAASPAPEAIQWVHQKQIRTTAIQLQDRFIAGQRAGELAYARESQAWRKKQAALAHARQAAEAAWQERQVKLADPDLDSQAREELAKAPLPAMPGNDASPPPTPFNGEPKANESFDALIYQFRQAAAARDHAKASALMAQMAALAPKVSPSLMGTFLEDVKAYLATLPAVPGASAK